MKLHRFVLRTANALFNLVLLVILLTVGVYSAYALWDNERVYAAAGDVQADMIRLKPETTPEAEEEGADFSELLAVNSDVCGWITMDGTQINYPILQGENNFSYINTDVYGNYALAGSIFLDARNDRTFADPYSLLYGHHMADHKMFGDLDLYKEADFFRENRTGSLILPNTTYKLEILACMLVGAGEDNIFEPTGWQAENIPDLLQWVSSNSMYVHEELLSRLETAQEPIRLLCLSTCSYEFTDARTVVLTVMGTHTSDETGGLQE